MSKNLYFKHTSINWDDPIAVAEYNKQYYEAHKKLKGRRSTSGLNEEGRSLASYVKEGINSERDKKIATSKSNRDSTVSAKKTSTDTAINTKRDSKDKEIEQHKTIMNSKIDSLKNRLSHMSTYDKKKHKDEIYAEIAKLREENAAKREELNSNFSADRLNLKADYTKEKESQYNKHSENVKAYRNEADERYMNALDKIKADSRYQKATKTKSSSKTGTKSSSKYKANSKTSSFTGYKVTKSTSNNLEDAINKRLKAKK